jgi:hypothetical protein
MEETKMYEKEYESLRNELNENRKYVFERPLLIFSVACIFFDYVSKTDYVMLFPCLIILLLLFNLHFTANRLNSSARIIAYIRLFIEKNQPSNYQWETFLNAYRLKGENKGLKYYPVIYYFHIMLIIFLLLLEILLYFDGHQLNHNPDNVKIQITTIGSIALMTGAIVYFFSIWKFISPKYVRAFFEKEADDVIEIIDLIGTKKIDSNV